MLQARIQNLRRAPLWFDMFSLRVYYAVGRRGGGGMRGVIDVDILFFVNALIGYFLLRGAALLAGRIAADWRIFLGAAAAGLYSAAAAFASSAAMAHVGGQKSAARCSSYSPASRCTMCAAS